MQTGKDVFHSQQANCFKIDAPKVYESWVTKKAPGMFKSDKRRWMALYENGEIHYFTNPEMTGHKGMLTITGLSPLDVQNLGSVDGGKYAFTIKTSLRLWHFSTENEAACKAWKKNIDAIITAMPPKQAT